MSLHHRKVRVSSNPLLTENTTPRESAEGFLATTLLTTKQVSAMTGVPTGTLRCWRAQGKGPAYYRLERSIRYDLDEVKSWLKSNRHIPSVRQFMEERHVAL